MTTANNKAHATHTRKDAAATARSAASTVRSGHASATKQTKQTKSDLRKQSKRVIGAYRDEVKAVRSQPTRPLYFALGVADRTVGAVKDIPSTLTPSSARKRVVATVRSVGDLAERAQRGYTHVAEDGESLVSRVRHQDSTKRVTKRAEDAVTHAKQAAKDVEKSVEAAVDAVRDASSTVG